MYSLPSRRLPVHDFGADEFLLEIGMDGPGGFHSRGVDGDGPGAAFVFAGGEETHQAEERIGG
jgi:hypothetical protein